ncbi:hypothetical protein [Sinorhizobium meliloti]|uniref:hypothetical protein n=1 Tax=Rhizobium meliloti TaxID=382 RepID=UPI00299D6B55|nr:hypothetical protein [Sinorhizobium meliloti]MDW9991066.1 hypothetical protein [Sinorhizobium meliloti]MDX0245466.1 hypothetical protein [Sinorhizobium meliloti]MDX0401530.1 hypothetical protein [Sinorhizobium meliloti]
MTNITDLIPEDAITVAATPAYTAWKSTDSTEAWMMMLMNLPGKFVTESILIDVVRRIYEDGGYAEKVTIPDGRALGVEYGKRLNVYEPTDFVVTDYGTLEIVDLKRNEIDALAEPFIANLKDGIEALGKLFEESGFDNDAGEFLLERARQWLA